MSNEWVTSNRIDFKYHYASFGWYSGQSTLVLGPMMRREDLPALTNLGCYASFDPPLPSNSLLILALTLRTIDTNQITVLDPRGVWDGEPGFYETGWVPFSWSDLSNSSFEQPWPGEAPLPSVEIYTGPFTNGDPLNPDDLTPQQRVTWEFVHPVRPPSILVLGVNTGRGIFPTAD